MPGRVSGYFGEDDLRCSPRRLGCLLILICSPSASARNGYVASFSTKDQVAATRTALLSPDNSQVARMSAGFTIMLWLRFRDPDKPLGYSFGAPFNLLTATDSNFMQPFAGLHGGWEFGSLAPATVTTLSDWGTGWHHYALSWNASNGARSHYIDGKRIGGQDSKGAGNDFLSSGAYITLGMQCLPARYTVADQYTTCPTPSGYDGEMDDVAVFAGALSASEVAARWNASLADRIAAASEPNLVLFWNFNEPLASEGWISNLGTAGPDYDLSLGVLPKHSEAMTCVSVFSTRYEDQGGTIRSFVAPVMAPSTDSRAWSVPKALDTTAPLVITASANSTVSGTEYSTSFSVNTPVPFRAPAVVSKTDANGIPISIHVIPRTAPSVPSLASDLLHTGREDTSLWIKLLGTVTTGTHMTARITQLPSKGLLYDVPTSKSTSTDTPVRTVGQALTQGAGYVMYVPDSDSYGSPHVRQQHRGTRLSQNARILTDPRRARGCTRGR
jgi:hypothetical protein